MKTAETSTDLVRIYLRDIGRVPLLTRDQQLLYGKQVQYMAALNQVKDSLSAHSDRDPTIMEWALAAGLSQSDLQMTLAKVGASLGISRERVRQIEQQALCKLARHRADINKFLAS